uniref:DUF5641 domain-containing protein n=1 Tax=Phlebotomus papatasi TaxID=29031 RepID=A0A1B0DD37_PHLPP
AIHLEVVGDLTTNSFIAALRRFISRRSTPSHIYCDNATNFHIHKWSHVPTDINPADVISRGMLPLELINDTLWWNGPQFVTQTINLWPLDPTRNLPEPLAMVAVPRKRNVHPIELILSRSNKFRKVTRILAYVLRIFSKTKTTLPLTPVDLDHAEKRLISFAQDTYLHGAKLAIQNGNLTSTRAFRHLWPLSLFVDHQGLIRIGGRLKNSSEGYDIRHPILLPKCNLSYMIATQFHQDHQHIGPQLLLATLRQRY